MCVCVCVCVCVCERERERERGLWGPIIIVLWSRCRPMHCAFIAFRSLSIFGIDGVLSPRIFLRTLRLEHATSPCPCVLEVVAFRIVSCKVINPINHIL